MFEIAVPSIIHIYSHCLNTNNNPKAIIRDSNDCSMGLPSLAQRRARLGGPGHEGVESNCK